MAKGKAKNNEDEAFWEAILAEKAPSPPCELCGRDEVELTQHHLIPKSRHDKARTKREFSRDEMKNDIAMLCPACHAQVHEVFSNQELSNVATSDFANTATTSINENGNCSRPFQHQ